ncbi:MAG: hypothetical protein KGD72_01775 [Candidatus Lokiarchaeota archaeon]|nr:hypothetical protein [Candidatus Lokiarchaeota archaeon]
MEAITINKYVQVICPVCKSKDVIQIPKSVINNATQLTTISVPKGKICQHHFQLFLDKNFVIRGYQKVDFQIINDQGVKLDKIDSKEHFVNSLELYNSSDLDKNKPKTIPRKPDIHKDKKCVEIKIRTDSKMTLKEIYDEFWEFIDNNNETFRKFILRDKRRRLILGMNNHTQRTEHQFLEILPKN